MASWLTTRSNVPAGKGNASARPTWKPTSTPALDALRRAASIISGEASMPCAEPAGPTDLLSATVRLPGPQPTSRTRSPGRGPASSTTAGCVRRMSGPKRASYRGAQWMTCPRVASLGFVLAPWIGMPRVASARRHAVTSVGEVDHDREVDVDRLPIDHAGLVPPLPDRLDGRLFETAVATSRSEHLNLSNSAILANDCLEHETPENVLALGV